ncbi:MAG: hypothetical protein US25_C0005G0017 [Candidatus Moranbacteria bacterium GW2011_GWE1_36_7]|nr:MAG: hypothetical protein UR99_C0008G0005 [Candidatus Moranbacteria bacterium GW2011_GWD2_36_12]KKQ06843.1 MAG: hypothetical protein US16_C0008G0020 [Candidatus Moranbacteria bacterium GW2011_GWE2_36_40]KKQ15433.1 MAG: hypothetical protein US25_C0005G0017 [Candidatus Moranbacteria bacterium GW2011_GWE1_36_7]
MQKINFFVVVLLIFPSFVSAAEWIKKDTEPGNAYTDVYVWETCTVMVPVDGKTISLVAHEKWSNGIVNQQFAQVARGKLILSMTTRIDPNNTDPSQVFERICLPAVKDLPPQVRQLFGGYMNIR